VTQQNNSAFPLMISIVVMDAAQLASVYALLGGTSHAALSSGNQQRVVRPDDNAQRDTAQSLGGDETLAREEPAPAGTGPSATTGASPSDGEIDAHGHPWSADLHASTKGKTKDGLWRMKVGVTRPDPLPGFPAATGTGTSSGGTEAQPTPSATSQTATAAGTDQPATSPAPAAEEDDEFAAFRNAAAASEATDTAAAPTARQFSDADLGALCNQAAVKLGDPGPVKEIIARYVPAGEVAHSRNIPAEQREAFAQEVEAKAGIQFAG
jgi:hypothetical protein